jgi:hypothetical protein
MRVSNPHEVCVWRVIFAVMPINARATANGVHVWWLCGFSGFAEGHDYVVSSNALSV